MNNILIIVIFLVANMYAHNEFNDCESLLFKKASNDTKSIKCCMKWKDGVKNENLTDCMLNMTLQDTFKNNNHYKISHSNQKFREIASSSRLGKINPKSKNSPISWSMSLPSASKFG